MMKPAPPSVKLLSGIDHFAFHARGHAMHLGKCSRVFVLGLMFAALVVGAPLVGQTTGDDPKTKGKFKGKKAGELKKYEDVITAKAKTTPGVFTVHRLDDKVYFEISPKAL